MVKLDRSPTVAALMAYKISTSCVYAVGIANSMIDPVCRTNITPTAAIILVK